MALYRCGEGKYMGVKNPSMITTSKSLTYEAKKGQEVNLLTVTWMSSTAIPSNNIVTVTVTPQSAGSPSLNGLIIGASTAATHMFADGPFIPSEDCTISVSVRSDIDSQRILIG